MKTKNTGRQSARAGKSDNTKHGSLTGVDSSLNKTTEQNVNMPQGAESVYKEELLKSNKKKS
jgi:hypothetical protein